MAETFEKWCGLCLATTAHTMVKNLWVCDKCAEKKTEIKTEEILMTKKMTVEEKADIISRLEAGEKAGDIATALGKHISVIYYTLKNAGKAKKQTKTKAADKPAKKNKADKAAPASSFKASLLQMVSAAMTESMDARLEEFETALDLDAKIEAAVERILARVMK